MENGLIQKVSSQNFNKTVNTITNRIEAKGLRIFALIHHHENAERNGYQLAPTTLIIFGNPNVGAPLMQLNKSIGIDLPMKMLVTESEGKVHMTYNQPQYLKSRHYLPSQAMRFCKK